jgi:nucleoside-diphosphate-sugar epimerase
MPKVLVTGAAGQVGCRLVRQLLDRNYEVVGTILPNDPSVHRLHGLDVELVVGDLSVPEFAERAVQGVDAVLHTANLVGDAHFHNNVMATFNVAKACAARADELVRLVSVSSSAVYPNDSHALACAYHPVDEQHPKRPMGAYALSKLVGEEIVNSFALASGLRTAIVRPSGIVSGDAVLSRWTVGFVSAILRHCQTSPRGELYLGPDAEPWVELEKLAQSPSQPCAVTGPDGKPWVYQLVDARDVAAGIICALESEAAVGEAFNVSCPRPIPYTEAARILEELTGEEAVQFRAPVRWVFDLDNTKARSWIGLQPKWDIREMLEDALAFRAGESDGY